MASVIFRFTIEMWIALHLFLSIMFSWYKNYKYSPKGKKFAWFHYIFFSRSEFVMVHVLKFFLNHVENSQVSLYILNVKCDI